ncbi:MAG: hypothetical protein CSB47_10100 [Proteobacteria bacterium]|nr:MAG: hypothetical protein CSB47_10100 [Pseudomonadota bacterium]
MSNVCYEGELEADVGHSEAKEVVTTPCMGLHTGRTLIDEAMVTQCSKPAQILYEKTSVNSAAAKEPSDFQS